MKINSLESLLDDELRDLYSAENQIIESLPKMTEVAVSDDLNERWIINLNNQKIMPDDSKRYATP